MTLVGLMFLTAGLDRAEAAEYMVEDFPGCSYGTPTSASDAANGSYDNNGNLYIPCGSPNTNASTIYMYDSQGAATKLIDLPYDVSDVAPSSDGNYLYLARAKQTPKRLKLSNGDYVEDTNWKLARYPMDATTGWYIDPPAGYFIDTDNAGNVYLSDGAFSPNGVHTVVKYTSAGAFLTRFGSKHTTWDLGYFYHQLNGLAVSPDGSKVYTVEAGNNRIQIWERQGLTNNSSYKSISYLGGDANNNADRQGYCEYNGWKGKFAAPYDVSLDKAGNLYVMNTSCHQVLKFRADGAYITGKRIGTDNENGDNRPHGFAVAANGNVYIGQSGKKMTLSGGGDTTAPTVGNVTPQSGASGIAVSSNATATFSEAMDASTITGTTFTLKKQSATSPVAADRVNYDPTAKKATLYPNADLEAGATYTATVKGGVNGVKDAAGNPLAQDKTWSFTTASTSVQACDKWASVSGNDANPGTQAAPYLRIAKLIRSLAPGETGCLKAGETFEEPAGEFIIKDAGGTPGNPITIRSSGTPRAKIKAGIHLQATTHDIVFRDLDFVDSYVTAWDGSPYLAPDRSTMLNIQGDRIELRNNDLSFKRGHCVNAGNLNTEGGVATDPAENFVLDGNRIHNCGTDLATFNESGGEHGVYLTYTTGARITNNYIYDNHVRGLQLYPKAEGTLVEHNVLDGNSQNVNIGSYQSAGHFSRDATVKNNIITNSALQHPDDKAQIHGFYPAGTSDTKYNNTISENCIYQQDPTKNFSGIGYTQTNNIFSDPLYKDRAAKNFALQDGSPCAGKGPQTFVQPPGPNTRPSIIILSPAPLSETTNRRPTISATVRDAETDLQKSHVKIYIDDKLILDNHYGYRPADDYLWREFEREDPDFAYGTHTARVVATDPQGLSTEKSWSFKVVPPNTIAPNTTITSGPSGTVRTTTASFSFSSSEAGSRFQCSLDRGAFTACSSPKSYTGLANDPHTFLGKGHR